MIEEQLSSFWKVFKGHHSLRVQAGALMWIKTMVKRFVTKEEFTLAFLDPFLNDKNTSLELFLNEVVKDQRTIELDIA